MESDKYDKQKTSQLSRLEHLTFNEGVVSSSLTGVTIQGSISMVRLLALGARGCRFESCLPYHIGIQLNRLEHLPDTQKVIGSIPIIPTIRIVRIIRIYGEMVSSRSPKALFWVRVLVGVQLVLWCNGQHLTLRMSKLEFESLWNYTVQNYSKISTNTTNIGIKIN